MKPAVFFGVSLALAIVAGAAFDSGATLETRHWLEITLRWFFFIFGLTGATIMGFGSIVTLFERFTDRF